MQDWLSVLASKYHNIFLQLTLRTVKTNWNQFRKALIMLALIKHLKDYHRDKMQDLFSIIPESQILVECQEKPCRVVEQGDQLPREVVSPPTLEALEKVEEEK